MDQRAFSVFGASRALSKHGDPLEVLDATVDFEYFRGWLVEGLGYGDGSKAADLRSIPCRCSSADPSGAAQPERRADGVHDPRPALLDAVSRLRSRGPTPDENTIRLYRDKLTASGTLKRVMKAFDWQLQKKGTSRWRADRRREPVPAPKQRNTDGEKERSRPASRAGDLARRAEQGRPEGHERPLDAESRRQGPLSARRDASADDRRACLRYKIHISIDRQFGFIRESAVTSASAPTDACSGISSRPKTRRASLGRQRLPISSNEKWLASKMLTSRPSPQAAGKPMPQATARANAKKSSIRARIEHVFAHQKNRFGLFIRTIGSHAPRPN